MTDQGSYNSGNLWKICNTVGPKFTKIVSLGTDYKSILLPNILGFWNNDVSKITQIVSSLTCHLRFSIFVIQTLKSEWQCSQYLELNPTCALETTPPDTVYNTTRMCLFTRFQDWKSTEDYGLVKSKSKNELNYFDHVYVIKVGFFCSLLFFKYQSTLCKHYKAIFVYLFCHPSLRKF